MFPVTIPKGTTPRTLFTEVLPREHARLVRDDAGASRATVRLEGDTSFVIDIRGRSIDVREDRDANEPLWLSVAATTLARFLEDWTGEGRWLPKFPPRGDVALLTDPRLLRRLAMVHGSIELALVDFEGGRVAMKVGAGKAPSRDDDDDDDERKVDVSVEATMATFEALLAGKLAPDEAIAEGHVKVKGKLLVAMQFALALAPYFPRR